MNVWVKSCNQILTYFRRTDFLQMLHTSSLSMTMQFACLIRAAPCRGQGPGAKLFFCVLDWNHMSNEPICNVSRKFIVDDNEILMYCQGHISSRAYSKIKNHVYVFIEITLYTKFCSKVHYQWQSSIHVVVPGPYIIRTSFQGQNILLRNHMSITRRFRSNFLHKFINDDNANIHVVLCLYLIRDRVQYRNFLSFYFFKSY